MYYEDVQNPGMYVNLSTASLYTCWHNLKSESTLEVDESSIGELRDEHLLEGYQGLTNLPYVLSSVDKNIADTFCM